jgi:hypothetical protein
MVELTTMIYMLSFVAPFEDKLEYGIEPFAVLYLSQKLVGVALILGAFGAAV